MQLVLVIARFQENLDWITKIPANLQIVVVNKGNPVAIERDNLTVLDTTNVGREAESYVRYIIQSYQKLPDRVIFTQGDPFEHSPFFLDLLQDFSAWHDFQPLSLQFKDYLPPQHIRKEYLEKAVDTRIWVDRTNGYTLNTVFYDDSDFQFFANTYRQVNRLSENTNLVEHFLKSNGFHVSQNSLNEVNFCFGAIFSVSGEMIKMHSQDAYLTLLGKFHRDKSLPYIAERCWMALFDSNAAMRQSQWSLHLPTMDGNPTIDVEKVPRAENAMDTEIYPDVHPNRDFILEIVARPPTQSRTEDGMSQNVAKREKSEHVEKSDIEIGPEVHPNRDFILEIVARPPTRSRSEARMAQNPARRENSDYDIGNHAAVHPNRDFVLEIVARPPTQRSLSSFRKSHQSKVEVDKTSAEEVAATDSSKNFVIIKPPTRYRYMV